jgi:transketolase
MQMKNSSDSDFRINALEINLDIKSRELREIVLMALEGGGRGHLGPALSLLEILRALYENVLIHNPANPTLESRDRFILSKGHGVLGLYSVLASQGYFSESELVNFCKYDSRFPGHPETGQVPGIEFSTGSLGHGLPVAVGVAAAARIKNQNWRTFVLMGDGEMAEGSNWEAALHASKHRLGSLQVIVDYNMMQASGDIRNVLPLGNILDKWRAFGFEVDEVNGHDIEAIAKCLNNPSQPQGQPRFLLAHTIKGKGFAEAENSTSWHHKAKISPSELASLRNTDVTK